MAIIYICNLLKLVIVSAWTCNSFRPSCFLFPVVSLSQSVPCYIIQFHKQLGGLPWTKEDHPPPHPSSGSVKSLALYQMSFLSDKMYILSKSSFSSQFIKFQTDHSVFISLKPSWFSLHCMFTAVFQSPLVCCISQFIMHTLFLIQLHKLTYVEVMPTIDIGTQHCTRVSLSIVIPNHFILFCCNKVLFNKTFDANVM